MVDGVAEDEPGTIVFHLNPQMPLRGVVANYFDSAPFGDLADGPGRMGILDNC